MAIEDIQKILVATNSSEADVSFALNNQVVMLPVMVVDRAGKGEKLRYCKSECSVYRVRFENGQLIGNVCNRSEGEGWPIVVWDAGERKWFIQIEFV